MKSQRIILAAALATVFGAAHAFTLKTDADKVGYAIGVDMGQSVKQFGGDGVNINAVILGLRDAYDDAKLAMTSEEMQKTMEAFSERKMKELEERAEKAAIENAEAGKAFLAENAKKDGVVTTASGLQYKVETQGEGAKPTEKDTVTVNYEGKLINGEVFDSSYERKEPVTFAVTDVIPGWVEGLQLMNVGSKYIFYIPSDLAYGEVGAGPAIPPNSTLIFQVELLKIEAPKADDAAAEAAEPAEEKPAEKPAE